MLQKTDLYTQLNEQIEVYALASDDKREEASERVFTTAIEILKIDLQNDGITESAVLTQDHRNRIQQLITNFHFASQKVKVGIGIIIADQYEMIKNITPALNQITDLLPSFQTPCQTYDKALLSINQALQTYVEGCLHQTHKPLADSPDSKELYQQLLVSTIALREQNADGNLSTVKKSVLNTLIQFATKQHQNSIQLD